MNVERKTRLDAKRRKKFNRADVKKENAPILGSEVSTAHVSTLV
jgi:hypothetical protein